MSSLVAAAVCASLTSAAKLPVDAEMYQTGFFMAIRDANTACALGSGAESNQVGEATGTWPWQRYESAPFNSPVFDIITNGQPLGEGLIFITSSDNTAALATKEVAPLIMTDSGQLVGCGPTVNATNLWVASFEGNNILTYWNGISSAGSNICHGYGNMCYLAARNA